jgi:hypothetical protein
MTKIAKIGYVCISVLFLLYLSLPNPRFPFPPPGSVQSMEEADTETPFKKAYFTNFDRDEVIDYYKKQFGPSIRLSDYPPEEAQILIRDQTRSTFLEELVHPFRESMFINGFEPKVAKDDIWYKGVHYRQKITIKYVSSNVLVRMAIAIPVILSTWFLIRETVESLRR